MNCAYELSGTRFAYGAEPVLDIDKLKINHSGITALVGPNGAGKSTLLNLLAFINPPAAGTMRFHEQEVSATNYQLFRRRVGYVQQKPYLFHASVSDNIELALKIRRVPKSERREQVRNTLCKFGLEKMAGRYAQGLSGGEAQKVALARALIHGPEVLIMDEPFNHLDRAFRELLQDLIRDIVERDKVTVIFTTHDQLHARTLADQVFSLIDGHLIPLSAMNLFTGTITGDRFNTDKLSMIIPPGIQTGTRLAIEANQLVLSRQELESSMRNHFPGRISKLATENLQILVTVEAGEVFHAVITPAALQELGVSIGDTIWVSFKSTSVHVF
ncbi:MAG: ABC transporter ATP-binding protein [Gammaproteobacteria bacterium]|nr:ABC transporter ATP-binding protein [Gammaproteobacteria bacterium]